MSRTDYAKYISGEDWKRRREALMDAHGSRCCLCRIPRHLANLYDRKDLNVHHRSEGYQHIGEETPEHVELRCQLCHGSEHGICEERTHRTDGEWSVLWWIVSRFEQEGRELSLRAAEQLSGNYIAVARNLCARPDEIHVAFAETCQRSRGRFPGLREFRAELERLRIPRPA